MSKFVIYEVIPRLFNNPVNANKWKGNIEENGCGKFNNFTEKALSEIKALGATHVWYMGIIEHATQTGYSAYGIRKDHPAVVKGKAGSPYAIKDYYDVNPDLAEDARNRMNEFEQLVERTHKAGMKVIIDFVPNHVARRYHSDAKPEGVSDFGENDHPEWFFSPLNNFYYIPGQPFNPGFDIQGYAEYPAKATGNDCFTASPNETDWYETVKLNYGVNYVEGMQKQFTPIPDTWNKMRDVLLFWASKSVDAFRCDMAEMVPVEFWGWVIPQVKKKYPEILFVAEIYQPAEYRNYICNGKFDYLYDKVGMYDTLRGIMSRNHSAQGITYAWQKLGDISGRMLNFLENHDEQRIGSGFFCGSGIYAQPGMIVTATLTQGPVMIYFGQELGELGMDSEGFSGVDGRTSIFDYWSVKSIQAWANDGKFDGGKLSAEQRELRHFYQKLLRIVTAEKAVSDGLMYDLVYANLDNLTFNSHHEFAYFRKRDDDLILVVVNFHDKELDTGVRIPSEAFQYFDMEEGRRYKCVDLLDETTVYPDVELSSQKMFRVVMPAWKGKIFKLTAPKSPTSIPPTEVG
ncbi:MAG: alpha-amylase family protein [Prevotellaceae bacterium]|jgi:glycosidase|nr:alpha-amylase family protein [Prevotellaceae bacterium]